MVGSTHRSAHRKVEPGPRSGRGPGRTALGLLAVGLAYYLTARLSLRAALVGHIVTPVWPPIGLAVVALLVFGFRVWPAIAVAAFAVNAPLTPTPFAAAAIAAGNTSAPLLAVYLLRRVGFRPELDRLKDALAIVFLGALVPTLVSATVGTTTLVASGALPAQRFAATWSVWWTGDAMGVLIVAPVLLVLKSARFRRDTPWPRRLEAALLFVGLAVASRLVLGNELHLLYLVFPFLIWAAWRFQQRGAAPAALLVSGMAVWAAVRGAAPFSEGSLLEQMVILQAFNGTVSLTVFLLAAMTTERTRAREDLERAGRELEGRVLGRTAELSATVQELQKSKWQLAESEERFRQLSDAAFEAVVVNDEGVIVEVNRGFTELFGYERAEVLGERGLELLVAPESRETAHHRMRTGSEDPYDLECVRKDGTRFSASARGWPGSPATCPSRFAPPTSPIA